MTKLTPTQDLLIEVLIARTRLGEHLWTFEARHRKALEQLQEQNLVMVMHGIVENTVRARLTAFGAEEFLSDSYQPPILAHYKLKKRYRS